MSTSQHPLVEQASRNSHCTDTQSPSQEPNAPVATMSSSTTQDAGHSGQNATPAYGQDESRRAYDLLYYLNSAALGRTMANNTENNGDPEPQTMAGNHNFIILLLLHFHLAMVMLMSSLVLWAIVGYKRPWKQIFEHPSEVLIFIWLLRILVKTCMNAWVVRFQCIRLPEPRPLYHSRRLYKIFTWIWLGLSMFFLIIRPSENIHLTSCKISFLLMWLTFVWNVSPFLATAVISILLYPLFTALYRYRTQGGLTPGLPRKLLQKLEVERFEKVVKRINRGELKRSPSKNESKDIARNDSNTSVPDAVTVGIGNDKESKSAEEQLQPKRSSTFLVLDKVCAICILEIDKHEKIFVMPCDIRHFFHRQCLNTWFKRSRMCPICRVNIGEALTKNKTRE